jgi:hypothetical protein
MGQELFHSVRQTYMTKLIVAYCNFVNGPKTSSTGVFHTYDAYFVSQTVVTLGQYRQHPASYATGSVSSRQRCGYLWDLQRPADVETRPRSPQNFVRSDCQVW